MPSSVLVLGVSASKKGQIEPPAYPKYVWKPATSNHSAIASTTRTAFPTSRFGQGKPAQQNAGSGSLCNKIRCCQRRGLPVGHARLVARDQGFFPGAAQHVFV